MFNLKSAMAAVLGRRMRPKADAVISAGELLSDPLGGEVKVPVLRPLGAGLMNIEYAAASITERAVLGMLVRSASAKRIFEIGSFRGVTALTMALNAPEPAVIWTLDLPPDLSSGQVASKYYEGNAKSGFHDMARNNADRLVGTAFRDYVGPNRIEQIFADSAKYDFSSHAPIDFFFVDGCHEYEAAKTDSLSAWAALRSGGMIIWHDYNWPSVERAAREVCPAGITWVAGTSIGFAKKP
jgi:predicted O-methyltransferase YrrM